MMIINTSVLDVSVMHLFVDFTQLIEFAGINLIFQDYLAKKKGNHINQTN